MQLKGIELETTIRLTQAADALDVKYTLTTNAANVDANFYSLMFFGLLNGDVTGVDGTPTTGIKFKVYETDDSTFHEATVAKLDWYETESSYISEAIPTSSSVAVGTDTYIREVEVIYTANDRDTGADTVIFSSTALGSVAAAVDDGNGVKGILLETANGAVDITVTHRFVIAK